MSARADLVERVADLVGVSAFTVEDPYEGWPALATVHLEDADIPIALYASPIGLSQRGRDNVERRFQNPGQNRPVTPVPGRQPVLLGVWEFDPIVSVRYPILVTADATRREGRATRWSVFVPLAKLDEAQELGWATHTNDAGELMRCMLPPLLPADVAADGDGVEPAEALVQTAATAAGLVDDPDGDAPAADRARRTATALVRDARFSRRVLSAYGNRCAMCGLGLSLVEGAHIYPASAPGSPDDPRNGLALCANHHRAFDRHLVAVEPGTGRILFHPDVLAEARTDPSARALVESTWSRLAPASNGARPRPAMFRQRYAHYPGYYDWAGM